MGHNGRIAFVVGEYSMTIVHAHDKFFKASLSNVRVAKSFFQHHLPASLQSYLNFNSLELQPVTYINPALQKSSSDILYKVNYLNSKSAAYICILAEHQSSVDPLMPLRVWQYITAIWGETLKKSKKAKLPLVIPIIFYNGKKKYDGSLDIRDLIEAPAELIERFLLTPIQLIDVQAISAAVLDEALRERYWSALMEFSMKHSHAKESLDFIQQLLEPLRQVLEEGATDYAETVLKYILDQTKTADPEKLLKTLEEGLAQSEGNNIMATVVDYLTEQHKGVWLQAGIERGIERGIEQGVVQGECRVLVKLLTHRFGNIPDRYLQKIHAADSETLLEWSERVLEAATLESIFKI